MTGGMLINLALPFLWSEVITMFDSSVNPGPAVLAEALASLGLPPAPLCFPSVVSHSSWHLSSLGSSTVLRV